MIRRRKKRRFQAITNGRRNCGVNVASPFVNMVSGYQASTIDYMNIIFICASTLYRDLSRRTNQFR